MNSFEVRFRFASGTKALNGHHHRLEKKRVRLAWVWKTFSSAWWATWGRTNIEKWRIFALSTASSWKFSNISRCQLFCCCAACHPLVRAPFTLSIFYHVWRDDSFVCTARAKKTTTTKRRRKMIQFSALFALPRLWACSHLADSKFLSTEKMCRRNEDDFLVSPSLLLLLCFHSVHNGWLKIAAYNSNASKISPYTYIAQACWLNRKNSKISLSLYILTLIVRCATTTLACLYF